MKVRTQISPDPRTLKRAKAKAATLGISFSEYVGRLIRDDLVGTPVGKRDISIVFDLVDEGPETNIARDKDKMVAEAVWHSTGRSG